MQSCAIAVLICDGRLPKPDLAVIVDTERERSSTWAYYDSVLRPRLAEAGVDLVRVPKSTYATCDLWGGAGGDLFLPGGFFDGGKAPMYCSNEWKSRVVDRWMRDQGVVSARMNRSSCVAAVVKRGWPMPPRSSCWMCPNAGDREWLDLKTDYPEDFARAVELEREIRATQPGMTLHQSGKTLDLVDFGEAQMSISDCAGMCWV